MSVIQILIPKTKYSLEDDAKVRRFSPPSNFFDQKKQKNGLFLTQIKRLCSHTVRKRNIFSLNTLAFMAWVRHLFRVVFLLF